MAIVSTGCRRCGRRSALCDAAVVLFQLQVVATGCSVGDNDIRWTSWDGYKLVMAAMQHGNVTVGTTLNEGLPLKLG